jgi:phage terminase large subunit GpA-like protein
MSRNPVFSSFALGFAPDPYLTIDEWADRYRQLPKGASAEAGQYSCDRMPYLREIMQELSPQSPTQQVKVIKATQIGCTEVANNMAMYYMDIVPASQLMILPTEGLAKDHSNRKLTPSLRAMPYLAKKINSGKSKDDIGGMFEKVYPGGMLKIAWAGSPANFRSLSCRVVILDDVDGYKGDIDGEGDPLDLGKKRTDSFGMLRKIYINSTPTEEGASNIEAEFEASDQRHYYMPCPHCESMITFEKDNFVFDYDKQTYGLIGDVQYSCSECGSLIDELHKTKMMAEGKWIPHNPGHIHRGYRIPSYLSPIGFLSWNEIFREFLESKALMNNGDVRKMKTWVNTRDARVWEEEATTVSVDNLPARKEEYGCDVPNGVLVLAAGIDTQNDRFEVEVVGYGKYMETWSIDYNIIQGDPNNPETRDALAAYLNKTFKCCDGSSMKIYAKGVDTGGHRSKAAYAFCKPRFTQRVFALKGSSVVTAPFINKRASKQNKGKVNLFLVGVNAGKDEIYANLEITEPGPNYMHFPNKPAYNDEYFKQLTAEKRDKKTGIWSKKRHRNEAIDCRNYANAALALAGIDEEVLNMGRRFGVVAANGERSQNRRRRVISRGRR